MLTCSDAQGREGRTLRHSNLKYALVQAVSSITEPPRPQLVVEQRVKEVARPRKQLAHGEDLIADLVVTLPPRPDAPAGAKGVTRMVDTVVSVPFAKKVMASLKESSPSPSFATAHSQAVKHAKYTALFHLPPGLLVPFAVDTFGGFGSAALDFMDSLFPRRKGKEPEDITYNLKMTASRRLAINLIAVGIAKGNQRCVLKFTNPADERLIPREQKATAVTARKKRAAPGPTASGAAGVMPHA
jgi:hypothetical protein